MESISLNNVLKNIYDNRVSFIRGKNIELEREYFTQNGNRIPMSEIFSGIGNSQLRKNYLEKTETLREAKHEETKSFAHVTLPITYFLDHTFLDFMSMEHKSPILEDTAPTGTKKILLPKC